MKSLPTSFLRYLAIVPVFLVVFAFTIPAFGQTPPAGGGGTGQGPAGGGGNGLTPAGGGGGGTPKIDTVALENPLNGINSIEGLLVAILNIIMILMVPVIVFFIIYAGFKYVMAQGNASQVEEATRALTYAIIGGVLILGAVAISQIIQSVVDAF
jgi:Type IV secretion system pilin